MKHRALMIILFLALASRLLSLGLIYPSDPERAVTADGLIYSQGAQALLALGSFAKSPQEPDRPQTLRTPGYSVFLALGYAIFDHGNLPALLGQIILSLLIIILTYCIAIKLWGQTSALWAAALAALDPNSFLFCQMLQTEILFTTLLLAALWAGLRLGWLPTARPGWAWLFSLLLALATLVRPISYYLFWPLMLLLVWQAWRQGWGRRALAMLLLALLLPWLLMVGGWQARNYLVTGSAQFSHLQALLLLDYQASAIVARQQGLSLDQARAKLRAQAESALEPQASPTRRYQAYQELAGQVLRQHPEALAREVLTGLVRVLFNPLDATIFDYYGGDSSLSGSLGDLGRLDLAAYVAKWSSPQLRGYFLANMLGLAFILLMYAAALRAGPAAWSQRPQLAAHLLLLLTLAYLLAAPSGPGGSARFRIPALPILAIYAGHGLRLFLSRKILDALR